MKISKFNTYIQSALLIILLSLGSCDSPEWNYPILATHSDGIKNLDEEGIDCGGSSGTACPSCEDGKKNGDETGIDCGGTNCPACPAAAPRADALKSGALPYFFTFETATAISGKGLYPRTTLSNGQPYPDGVDASYGIADPTGGTGAVTKMVRPNDGRFGGYEDFKFQPFTTPIDFFTYHKWTMMVYIPTGQDFSGALNPQVEIILHDDMDDNYNRWTVISQTIDASDFGKWVTLEFDGTNAAAAGSGTLLPANTTYTNITIRFGGSNHKESGIFYVKDFLPTTRNFTVSATPRADALASSNLPYYFTWESNDSSKILKPFTQNTDGSAYGQGVDLFYGENNPDGTPDDLVTKVVRPNDMRFGGYEDFKFQTLTQPFDFSEYHKWTMEVYIPTGQDFSGALIPEVVIILHDYDADFFNRWTEIKVTIPQDDFGKWVTLTFDGTNAKAEGSETLLPQNTTYTNMSLRFGGSNHGLSATFYVKNLKPVK